MTGIQPWASSVATKRKNKQRHATGHFVVGGSLSPDRDCYVQRAADDELYWHLKDGEYCHVLGPRQIGKSSIIARVAKRLRAEDQLVAIVDLTQFGSKEKSLDPGRWYYGLAYRIVRELRLKANLQKWWQERSSLSVLQRLVEFFWEVVLANTTAPVVVIFDEIERTIPLDFSDDFFASLRACYNARAADSEYRRLSFVIAGAATPAQLVKEASQAPFAVSKRIALHDFVLEQCGPLMRGLNLPSELANRAMRRILYWTGGQPFLTQKLCRAVAGQDPEENMEEQVDRLCRQRFLVKNAVRDEPNLNYVRNSLTTRGRKGSFTALTLYGRVCKDGNILAEPGARDTDALLTSGIVKLSPKRTFVPRNQIYEKIFTPRWVNQNLPFDWKGISAAVSASALILAVPLWYTQILPKPYIETLNAATQDYQLAVDAYEDLRGIPGYGATADRLLTGVLIRRSRGTMDYGSVLEADTALRRLPAGSDTADMLLGEFWGRRARVAEARGKRDEALLFHLQSQSYYPAVSQDQVDRLRGEDYEYLLATIRPGTHIEDLKLRPDGQSVTMVTDGNAIQVWDIHDGGAHAQQPFSVVAEDFVPVVRHVSVEEAGLVSRIELLVGVDHTQPHQLYLQLAAPSGKTAELRLLQGVRTNDGEYKFAAATHRELRGLVGEKKSGSWTLTVEDHAAGVSGTLNSWGLRFSRLVRETVVDGSATRFQIPDPRTTEQVLVMLSPTGNYAAVRSQDRRARGHIHIWRVPDRAVVARIPRQTGREFLAFGANEEVVITASVDGAPGMRVWSVDTGREVMAIDSRGSFDSRPTLSPAGHFLAVADIDGRRNRSIRIWDLAAGMEMKPFPYNTDFSHLAISAGGELLATSDRDKVVRIWRVSSAELIGEFEHARPLTNVHFEASGRWLMTKDQSNYARIWDIRGSRESPRPVAQVATLDAHGLTFGPGGNTVVVHPSAGSYQVLRLPGGAPAGAPFRHPVPSLRADRSSGVTGSQNLTWDSFAAFSTDGTRVLTGKDGGAARLWELDVRATRRAEAANPFCGHYPVVSAALSTDGATWGVSCGSGSVLLWSADRTQRLELVTGELTAFGDVVHSLVFSDDGTVLAGGTHRGAVRLWDVISGTPRELGIKHDRGAIFALAFSPDGRRLVTAGELGARLWDADSGEPQQILGANDPIRSVAFSPDGSMIATGNGGGALSLWHLPELEVIAAAEFEDSLEALTFSRDGTSVIVGTDKGDVSLWNRVTGLTHGESHNVGTAVYDTRVSDDGAHLIVQTNDWMHLFAIGDELKHLGSRLLPEAAVKGAFLFSDADGQRVKMFLASSNVPEPAVFPIARLKADSLAWNAGAALQDWQSRLALAIGENGQVVSAGDGDDRPLLSQE